MACNDMCAAQWSASLRVECDLEARDGGSRSEQEHAGAGAARPPLSENGLVRFTLQQRAYPAVLGIHIGLGSARAPLIRSRTNTNVFLPRMGT